MDERELAKAIGAAARGARRERGLTQADTAEQAGISVEFYARIERGQTMPSVPTLVRLARALEISTDALVAGAPPLKRTGRGRPEGSGSAPLRTLLRRLDHADARTLRLLNVIALELDRRR